MLRSFLWVLFWGFALTSSGLAQCEKNQPPFLPMEGGGITIQLDRRTPLPQLVQRLESNWELRVTGKGYWIGFTDDMFSIAAYKEAALPHLQRLMSSTQSAHTKQGVALTAHLIGLNSCINRRMSEPFKSEAARRFLCHWLKDQDVQIQILTLLIRDPHLTDIPYLIEQLKTGTPHAWGFVKALQRYPISNKPVHTELPKELGLLECPPTNAKPGVTDEYLTSMLTIIDALQKTEGVNFQIEPHLVDSDFFGDMKFASSYPVKGRFGGLLSEITATGFCWLGLKLEYFVEDHKVVLCGMETARQRWLDWSEANPTKHLGSQSKLLNH
ncbi:MAG: hypothetical protein K1Y36_21620 [Blastocatellia bacterium]|nr:hypothetical protein [Blastocatellia bacterium]